MRVFPDRSRSIDMITDPYDRSKNATQESGVRIDLREQSTPFQQGRHSRTQIQQSISTMTPEGPPKPPQKQGGISSNSFTISPRYLGRHSPAESDRVLGTLESVDVGVRLKTARSIVETEDDVRIESARKHSPRQKLVVKKIQEVTDVGNRIHEAMAYQTMKAVEFLSGNQELVERESGGSGQFKFDDVTRGAKLSNLLKEVQREEAEESSPINAVESGQKYKIGTLIDEEGRDSPNVEKVKEEVKLELQFSPAF